MHLLRFGPVPIQYDHQQNHQQILKKKQSIQLIEMMNLNQHHKWRSEQHLERKIKTDKQSKQQEQGWGHKSIQHPDLAPPVADRVPLLAAYLIVEPVADPVERALGPVAKAKRHQSQQFLQHHQGQGFQSKSDSPIALVRPSPLAMDPALHIYLHLDLELRREGSQ